MQKFILLLSLFLFQTYFIAEDRTNESGKDDKVRFAGGGLWHFSCSDILFNFDQDYKKPETYYPNDEASEEVLSLLIQTIFGTMNYFHILSGEGLGKNTNFDSNDYQVSKLINECRKEENLDKKGMLVLLDYYLSLPNLKPEDIPEREK